MTKPRFTKSPEGTRILNIVGSKFGLLTATGYAGQSQHGSMFDFSCQCGGSVRLRGTLVTTGQQLSCGCVKPGFSNKGKRRSNAASSRVGEVHNRLKIVAFEPFPEGSSQRGYLHVCECLCGSPKKVKAVYADILSGKVKSCGCYQAEMASLTGSRVSLENGRTARRKWVYNKISMRSGLEVLYAMYLDSQYIRWEYEPRTFKLGNGIRYTPDFYLVDTHCWVEVKGIVTERFTQKSNLFRSLGNLLKVLFQEDIEALSRQALGLSYRDFLKSYRGNAEKP